MFVILMRSKSIFIIGFFIGFFAALFTLKIQKSDNNIINLTTINNYNNVCNDETSELCKNEQYPKLINGKWLMINKNKKHLEYKKWLKRNNIKISNINIDYHHYNNKLINNNNTVLESNWLEEKIHIICIVFVNKIKLAKAIKDTWGPRCNKLYFFSEKLMDNEIPVMKLSIKLTSSWQMLCEVMNYIWNIDNKLLQWTIFIKDDTIILLENLRYFVAGLDFNNDYYLGHPISLWGQTYNVAQAGYVLSRGSFRKIIETFNDNYKCSSSGKYWKNEDFYLGKHLSMLNIHPLDTRDYRMRGIFHGYSLQLLLWGIAKPSNYFTHALYPPDDKNCCSPKSITFTVAESDKLYTINYMLYHLNVFNCMGHYGNKLAPTKLPENEVNYLILIYINFIIKSKSF